MTRFERQRREDRARVARDKISRLPRSSGRSPLVYHIFCVWQCKFIFIRRTVCNDDIFLNMHLLSKYVYFIYNDKLFLCWKVMLVFFKCMDISGQVMYLVYSSVSLF